MTIDETRDLMQTFMTEFVPGEKYEILILEVDGQYKLELKTESKRALVAWSELSFMLEKMMDKQFNETLDFDDGNIRASTGG